MCSGLSYPQGGLELERQAPSVTLTDKKLLEQGGGVGKSHILQGWWHRGAFLYLASLTCVLPGAVRDG